MTPPTTYQQVIDMPMGVAERTYGDIDMWSTK